ncbi:MAG TPA: c-type cytochrome [Gammaproteobacteria bacterium]
MGRQQKLGVMHPARHLVFAAAMFLGTHSAIAQSEDPAVRVLNASPYSIRADAELSAFVTTTAEAAIEQHCSGCHGANLEGQAGVPNLVDYDWLWGVTGFELNDVEPVAAIQQTITFGVRNTECPDIEDVSYYGGCADTRYSEMPGYGNAGFTDEQVDDLTEFAIDLMGGEADAAAVARSAPLQAVCAECHGEDSRGYKPYGGPDLTDAITLYGGDRDSLRDVIANGRLGACPPWGNELDAATIKSLAVHIWNLAQGY